MDAATATKSVIDTVAETKEAVKPLLEIKAATAKTSLMRLTKDQIFQFPLIMNADIDDDEKFPIIKSIEKNYAQIVLTAIVNEGVINRSKYETINDFLKKFHNNNDIPFNALESELDVTEAIASEGYLPEKELIEMWDCIEEQLDSESINDMYLPYKRTAAKLSRAVEAAKMTVAVEAEEKYFRQVQYKKTKDKNGDEVFDKDPGGSNIVLTDKLGNPAYRYIVANATAPNYQKLVDELGEPKSATEWKDADLQKKIIDAEKESAKDVARAKEKATADAKSRIRGEVVKDDKFNNLTPTMLRMTIANIAKDAGAPWSQELILGVRAMPRLLPQSIMISNMVEAFKDREIFKFIKWTRGEINFIDALFGWTASREAAAMKGDRKWLKILRNRSRKDKLFRTLGMGHKLNPNTTIIITSIDAHMIQEKCGVNPYDITNVRKLMDKYFLLGFGIYDADGKMLNLIYDGETEFTNYSLRTMIAESKKDANLLTMGKY